MTVVAYRVAWMTSTTAATETHEDFTSHFLADVRVAELRAEKRPVVPAYRIDLEEAT